MPTNRRRYTPPPVEEDEEDLSAVRAARIGIALLFLIVIVTLADILRLEYSSAVPLDLARIDPYVIGALIATVCTAAAVALYFFKEYRYTTYVSGGTVLLLFAYKLWFVGF